MELSECCNERVLLARSLGGWYFNGELTHEWYECTRCKQPCHILMELGAEHEGNGAEEFRDASLEESEQGCTSGEGQELGNGDDTRAESASDVQPRELLEAKI